MYQPEVAQDLVCVNLKCEYFGVKGQENVMVRRRYGIDQIRFVRCRQCREEFSERRGTPLFDLRLSLGKIISVVSHLAEGIGVRKTSRLTKVSKDTVGRINKRVGKHAKKVHDILVQNPTIPEAQMDEMWAFVKKKTRNAPRKRG